MKTFRFLTVTAVSALLLCPAALASSFDRPVGIRIGQRMTLKPYVSAAATFDSNVESGRHGKSDVCWTVNPGLSLDYLAESWQVLADAYYQYNTYCKSHNSSDYNFHGYGENLFFKWSNSLPGEKGWGLMLTEGFRRINPTENMTSDNGYSYATDRSELRVAAGLQRRFGHGLHADINAAYYWLDFDEWRNENHAGLYGWSRWTAGGEVGWAPTEMLDILVSAGYQGYQQENNHSQAYDRSLSGRSDGWSIQGGIGSMATERITYRLLGGLSRFEYGGSNGKSMNGFTYSATGHWKISETWNTMLLATSYFQPTEREYGSAQRVDALSWGLGKTMVRGKLTSNFDVSYRRETEEYSHEGQYDYDLDVLTFRLGLNYVLNRYLTVYGNVEYRQSFTDSNDRGVRDAYEYERFRGTIGLRLTY